MKTMLIAAGIALALSTGLAKAKDVTPSLTFLGNTTCAEAKNPQRAAAYDGWVVGYWDASNRRLRDAYDAKKPNHGPTKIGSVGERKMAKDILNAVWAECRTDPTQPIESAVNTVYDNMLRTALASK